MAQGGDNGFLFFHGTAIVADIRREIHGIRDFAGLASATLRVCGVHARANARFAQTALTRPEAPGTPTA